MIASIKQLLPRLLGILLLGIVAGLAANQLSPRGLPLITPPRKDVSPSEYITIEQAKVFWDSGTVLFLDAREPADYEAGHIGNAQNLPAQSFHQGFGGLAPMLSPESPLVLYCDGLECELSHHLRESLHQAGYTNTYLLFNGMTVWRQAGYPIAKGGVR